jgi:protein involved in polysaccharide export with SLBB domain
MRVNCVSSRLVAAGVAVFLVCTFNLGASGPQDQQKSLKDAPRPEPSKKSERQRKDTLGRLLVKNDKVEAVIDKMIAEYDLKPRPVPEIPGDPPPHEGAMISLPYLIEPPDLVMVEVLDALPGRPISGERLVRPDGKISLGFYGEIDARGLTLEQLKVAIIKHLRRFLVDESLGVKAPELESLPPDPAAPEPQSDIPQKVQQPVVPGNQAKTRRTAYRSTNVPLSSRQSLPLRRRAAQPVPIHLVQSRLTRMSRADQQPPPVDPQEPPPKLPNRVQVVGSGQGRITINSKHYYVQGDVLVTGKLPCSGNETVLDALQHAGGLMPTAEPKDIRLVRPGRNGRSRGDPGERRCKKQLSDLSRRSPDRRP